MDQLTVSIMACHNGLQPWIDVTHRNHGSTERFAAMARGNRLEPWIDVTINSLQPWLKDTLAAELLPHGER